MRRLALAIIFCSSVAVAEESKEPSRIRYGMDMGYLHQQRFSEAQDSGVAMAIFHAQVQSVLVNPTQKGKSLALITQFTTAKAFAGDEAWVFGLDIMPRFLFGGNENWRFFVNGGLGFNVFGLEIPELSGKMQFTVLAGGGVQFQTSEHVAVTLEYRATHFSNNGILYPNHGINAHTFLIGASICLD